MMGTIKGDRLYVNLSASQLRRRLKGCGLGVRKIESAGRGRSVVIHTATGQHKRELQALLADVLETPEDEAALQAGLPTGPIEQLRNVGPATAAWLRLAGIPTIGQLRKVGPVVAYRRVKQAQPRATLNLLWALAAGLADQDWRELSDAQKAALQRQMLAD